ncbi:MAG: DUF3810 family protein [Acidobacteria bacterium]|nr:DUF3810 family protein [Acidobacteriota bacterium]
MKITSRAVAESALLVLALLAAWAPPAPAAIEGWFATGIYPAIQRSLTPLSNRLPFALIDLLGAVAVGLAGMMLARAAVGSIRTRKPWPALQAVAHLAGAAAVTYLVFLLLWGLNYRRVPMTERLVLSAGSPSSDAVVQLGLQAAAQLNALHAAAHRSGWREPPWEDGALRRAFGEVQQFLSDAAPAAPGRLKRSALGYYFRWTGVDGMINPFGLEVLVNPDLLPLERPFVAAHEWAHLAGYADESEASFVGWLTCVRASSPSQYSGWLALYWQVSGEIGVEDRARVAGALAGGPRADVDAIAARIRRGEWPWLRDAGWRIYDDYLKANRVQEGVRSYGAVITLILRARFEEGWVPVRRRAGR